MDGLLLVEASKELENAAMEYRAEHISAGEKWINGSGGLIKYTDYSEWLGFAERAKKAETSVHGIPSTTYFTVRESDKKIVGSIQLRHCLNDELRKNGGNIGYGIRPSERRKGYGKRQLALVLDKARELGIPRVMITCDKKNTASARTAVSLGGKLEWEGWNEEEQEVIQIYWIELA